MPDRPSGDGLLAEAQRLLLGNLLPRLPEEARYEARMIARAMAIAERELAASGAWLREEIQAARRLCGDSPGAEAEGEERHAHLRALEKRLCADIRAGRYDHAERRGALLAHLRESALRRVHISNPKAVPKG